MVRLIVAAVVVLGWSAPATRAQPAKPKAPSAKDIGESLPVLEELGLPPADGLPAKLPEAYRPDLITAADVRRDPMRYPLRAAVLDAVDVLRDARALPTAASVRTEDLTDKGKKAVVERQQAAARLILRLEEAIAALDALADARKKEPSRRWQAHFDYAAAALRLQLAGAHEYNFALGHVRTDSLPKLDPDGGQNGWRLVPAEKMLSRKDVRDVAEAGREAMARVRKDHPDTTWAALARRDAAANLGLRWEAAELAAPVKPKKKE